MVLNFSVWIVVLLLVSCSFAIEKARFFRIQGGDSLPNEDDGFRNVSIPSFTFFNTTSTNIFVAHNGILSFINGVSHFTADCGGMHATAKIIAPFWSDVNVLRGGNVHYRQSTQQADLDKVNEQLQRVYHRRTQFDMRWVFVATWDEVAFYNTRYSGQQDCSNHQARNTFQAILTNNNRESFVIFYYEKLEWISGTASNGDCNGMGGDPAKAGFDEGGIDGDFKPISNLSCTSRAMDIAKLSNVNDEGVYVFRVDGNLELPPPDAEPPQPTTTEPPTTTTESVPETTTFHNAPSNPTPIDQEPITSPFIGIQKPAPPAEGQCPARITKPTTPCRESLVNVIEHVLDFVKDFPKLCWGEDGCKSKPEPKPEPPTTTQEPTTTEVPTTTELPTIPVACTRDNDLAIILDSSGSIGAANYELAKQFISNLSHAFTQHPANRLTLVYYSSSAIQYISLTDTWASPHELSEYVMTTPYMYGGTNTPEAIRMGTLELTSKLRQGVPQSMIVLTDGVSWPPAAAAAEEARNARIQTFAIGIGSTMGTGGTGYPELVQIAGDVTRLHAVTDYTHLPHILNEVSKELCP